MFNLGNKEVTEATGAVVEGTKKLSMGKKVGIAAAVVGAVGPMITSYLLKALLNSFITKVLAFSAFL